MSPKNDSGGTIVAHNHQTPPSGAAPTPAAFFGGSRSGGSGGSGRVRPAAMLEREKFYLEQIRGLEAERNQLRRDAEREKQIALAASQHLAQSWSDGRAKLEALAENLSQVQVAKDDLEYRNSVEKAELERRVRDACNRSDAWRSEYALLADKCAKLESELESLRSSPSPSSAAAGSVVSDLSRLWQTLGCDDDEYEYEYGVGDGDGAELGNNNSDFANDVGEVTNARRLVAKYVRGIASKVAELQNKDAAYRRTLSEADKIVADVEQRYQLRIADLEANDRRLRARAARLEQVLLLGPGATPTCGARDDEAGAGLREQLSEARRAAAELESRLRDQGDVAGRAVDRLSRENAQLQVDYDFLAVTRRQLADLESRNKMLESRVEELDSSERSLQETVDRTMDLLKSKQEYYEGEVASLRRRLDDTRAELDLHEAEEGRWRSEAQTLTEALAAKEAEARRQRAMLTSMEECHRNEMTKAGSRLKELGDRVGRLDAANDDLRDELRSTADQLAQARAQVRQEEARYERSLVQLNLQLVAKDDEIQQLRDTLLATATANSKRRHDDDVDGGRGGGEERMSSLASVVRRLLAEIRADIRNCRPCSETTGEKLDAVQSRLEALAAAAPAVGNGDSDEDVVAVAVGPSSTAALSPTSALVMPLSDEMQQCAGMSDDADADADDERVTSASSVDDGSCSEEAADDDDDGDDEDYENDFDDEEGDGDDGDDVVVGDVLTQQLEQEERWAADEQRRLEVDQLTEKLRQAEEEGAVLASQLLRARDELLREKEESARLLLEVGNRKRRQSEAVDELRRENAVLRNEIALLRQRIHVAEERHKRLIGDVAAARRGSHHQHRRRADSEEDNVVVVGGGIVVGPRRFSAEEKAPWAVGGSSSDRDRWTGSSPSRIPCRSRSLSSVPAHRVASLPSPTLPAEAAPLNGLETISERLFGVDQQMTTTARLRRSASVTSTGSAVGGPRVKKPVVIRRYGRPTATIDQDVADVSLPPVLNRVVKKPIVRRRASFTQASSAPGSMEDGGLPASAIAGQRKSLASTPTRIEPDASWSRISKSRSFVSRIPRLPTSKNLGRRYSTPATLLSSVRLSPADVDRQCFDVRPPPPQQQPQQQLRRRLETSSSSVHPQPQLRRSRTLLSAWAPSACCDSRRSLPVPVPVPFDDRLLFGTDLKGYPRAKDPRTDGRGGDCDDNDRRRTTSGSSTASSGSCSSGRTSTCYSRGSSAAAPIPGPPSSSSPSPSPGGNDRYCATSSSGFNSLEDDGGGMLTLASTDGNHDDDNDAGDAGSDRGSYVVSSSKRPLVRTLPSLPPASSGASSSRDAVVIDVDLSPPTDFKVTRFVGDDSVLLAWEPPSDSKVSGYNIFVDGQFNSRVRSPHRTKALVSGIDRLQLPDAWVVVEIRSTTADGVASAAAAVQVRSPKSDGAEASNNCNNKGHHRPSAGLPSSHFSLGPL